MLDSNASQAAKDWVEEKINTKFPEIEEIYKGIQASIAIAIEKADAQTKSKEQRKLMSRKIYLATTEEEVQGAIDDLNNALAPIRDQLGASIQA